MLDGIRESESGLVVECREFRAELAIEAKEGPGFDGGQRVGEVVVAAWVGAGAEVAFHGSKVQVVAAGLKIGLFGLGAVGDEEVGDVIAFA